MTEHNPAPSPPGHPLLSGPPTLNDIHQIFITRHNAPCVYGWLATYRYHTLRFHENRVPGAWLDTPRQLYFGSAGGGRGWPGRPCWTSTNRLAVSDTSGACFQKALIAMNVKTTMQGPLSRAAGAFGRRTALRRLVVHRLARAFGCLPRVFRLLLYKSPYVPRKFRFPK